MTEATHGRLQPFLVTGWFPMKDKLVGMLEQVGSEWNADLADDYERGRKMGFDAGDAAGYARGMLETDERWLTKHINCVEQIDKAVAEERARIVADLRAHYQRGQDYLWEFIATYIERNDQRAVE